MYSKGGNFNYDYYVNKHMKLVHKLLDPFGLVKTEVNKANWRFSVHGHRTSGI